MHNHKAKTYIGIIHLHIAAENDQENAFNAIFKTSKHGTLSVLTP